MRIAKWKIPLRTIFRRYCLPLSRRNVAWRKFTETTRTSAIERHATILHVHPCDASGHFCEHHSESQLIRFRKIYVISSLLFVVNLILSRELKINETYSF